MEMGPGFRHEVSGLLIDASGPGVIVVLGMVGLTDRLTWWEHRRLHKLSRGLKWIGLESQRATEDSAIEELLNGNA